MTGANPSDQVNLLPVADSALLVEFENQISTAISERVLALAIQLERNDVAGIREVVVSYRALMVHYDPMIIDFGALCAFIRPQLATESLGRQGRHWRIPVFYGGEAAPDLARLAGSHNLKEEDVIEIHSRSLYRVYMMGFAPGWTFLGGLDQRLHTPRLETPRAEVPAGCISIGGQQTLIGGPAMPSGWNLIGQTPERTFSPEREQPFFMKAGDQVSFRKIDQLEFDELSRQAAEGSLVSAEVSPR